MKTFKQYFHEERNGFGYRSLLLFEELNAKQKKQVDGWTKAFPNANVEGHPNAVDISSHVIPSGQSQVVIPLEHGGDESESITPHPEVESHLKSHGYSVADYKSGFAKDKYGRNVSIAKVLNKTKAPQEVMNAFTNDPRRKGVTKAAKGLSVVISRHPHKVAGMSTDQGWTSCMNMKDGCNRHYLKDDIAEGTHVAYLVHNDDLEAKRPLARIALKPFEPISDGYSKPILRPEKRSYGDADSSFEKTVSNWAEKNFPLDEDKIYQKNSKVYDDSGDNIIASTKALLNSKKSSFRAHAFRSNNPDITPEDIDNALEGTDRNVMLPAINHPNASIQNLEKAMNNDNNNVRYYAAAHPNATREIMDRALHDPVTEVRRGAAKNPNLPSDLIDKILESSDSRLAEYAAGSKNITPKQIDKFLEKGQTNRDRVDGAKIALKSTNASYDNISKGLRHPDPSIRLAAYNHPNRERGHIREMVNDVNHPFLPDALMFMEPEIKGADLEQIYDNADKMKHASMLRIYTLEHPYATPKLIDKALEHPDQFIAREAAGHENATPDNLRKALEHPDLSVKNEALKNKNLTPELIDQVLSDGRFDMGMKSLAARNPNASKENLDKAMRAHHPVVREGVMYNPSASVEHIQRGLNDENSYVQQLARYHPKYEEAKRAKKQIAESNMKNFKTLLKEKNIKESIKRYYKKR